jgi:hypothetical protein
MSEWGIEHDVLKLKEEVKHLWRAVFWFNVFIVGHTVLIFIKWAHGGQG